MSRFVGRKNLCKRLSSLEGSPGRTGYADGVAHIEAGTRTLIVRPLFGLPHEGEYETVHLSPLFDALKADYTVATVLVRLGGYAVGVFEGERLVASKVGSRFVKGRHKKGGSSANRFRRRREEQVRALTQEAAAVAADTLRPWREAIEFAAFGGDRKAVADTLEATSELDWLGDRAVPRFFTVPEPRQRVLEKLPYDLYAAELTTTEGS